MVSAILIKYIQAVRRERRVEKACEGRRQEDIMRWLLRTN